MKEGKEGKKKENKKGDSHHPPKKKPKCALGYLWWKGK